MFASLLGAFLSGEAASTVKRIKTQIIVMAMLGAIALLGMIFLILAGYLFAAERLGALEAALWIGGSLIGASLIGLLVYRAVAGVSARRLAARRKADLSAAAIATGLALLPALASKRGGIGMVAAPFLAAIGYQIYKENVRPKRPEDQDDSK